MEPTEPYLPQDKIFTADKKQYGKLDLKERAWQATKSNDRSIGIEIANIGCYAIDSKNVEVGKNPTLRQWYKEDQEGKGVMLLLNITC